MMMMILLVQSEFVTRIMCYNSFKLQKELTKKKDCVLLLSFYLNYQSLSKKNCTRNTPVPGERENGTYSKLALIVI